MSDLKTTEEMEHIEQIVATQRQLQKQFNAFAEMQDQMYYKLSGNPLDKNDGGMIAEVKTIKSDVDKLKESSKRFTWMVAGGIIAGGALLQLILKVLKIG